MGSFFETLEFLKRSKTAIWIVVAPIILLPILQFGTKEASCCYCILLLSFYWIGEVVPIAVTSILPMLLFPLLGIMSAEDIAQQYLKDTTMMLVITVMAAIAVEECNLHRRIALKLLTKTGSKPQWIMASFMGATCFLSCWMDDCAATALMLPIAFATLESMNMDDEETGKPAVVNGEAWTTVPIEHCDETVKIPTHREPPKEDRTIWKAMILSCSYASLIGGTGTVIGTAPNLIFRDNVQTWYPNGETGVTYLSWMAFAVPPMVLYLIASWVTLQVLLIGPRRLIQMYSSPTDEDNKKAVRVKNSINRAYNQLGPITFAEKSVLTLYIIMILSWMTSDPGFMPGWTSLLGERGKMISDASVGIFIIFIMFIWPRECPKFSGFSDPSKPHAPIPRLLNWEVVHEKFPWSLLFLVGAGFATSRAVEVSGLSTLVSCFALDKLTHGSAFSMEALITTFVTFITEMMGNSGTASIFIPISFSIGEALKINPLYLALPLTISASFSFCFPMATPPNAIVYETGMITMFEMAYTGFLLDLVCIGITLLNMNTYTYWLFDLGHFPEGIQDRNTTLLCAPSF